MMEPFFEYRNENGKYGVRFPKNVLLHIHKLCEASKLLETGGILIGKYTDDLRLALVHKATAPPVGSKFAKMSFVRNGQTALMALDSAWSEQMYYLGEWNYHPFSSPAPSQIDLQTIRRFAQDRKLHCPEPIMLIIGRNSAEWLARVSVYANGKETVLNRIV